MNSIQEYVKQLSKTIDQSNIQLPPIWCRTEIGQRRTIAETQHELFISGKKRELANHVVDLINNARETVVVSSFLLADAVLEDAIFDATRRGVRVYLMLACETRLEGDIPDDDFGKECLAQHTKMLKRLAGRVMIRSAPHFHSKMVLVDALTTDRPSSAKGVLLTANLTREAFERNEELAVRLSLEEIQEAVELIRWAMFEYAEHEMLDNTQFSATKKQNTVQFPKGLNRVVCTTDSRHSIRTNLLKLIKESKQELMISSFGWQADHEVIDAICAKARDGVKVTVLSRVRLSAMTALVKMAEAGVEVFGYKWLHAKAIWNEHNHGMIMSANLQAHGLDTGFEVGLLLDDERAEQLRTCLGDLLENSSSDIRKLKLNTKLSSHSGEVEYWQGGRLQIMTVSGIDTIEIPSVTAECLTDLEVEPELPKTNWKSNPSCLVEYTWRVLPPQLPVNCKEILWEERVEVIASGEPNSVAKGKKKKQQTKVIKHSYVPKVYQLGKRKLIALTEDESLKDAMQLKADNFPTANIVLSKAG